MSRDKIAVIVAARDAGNTLERCLDSLLDLDYSDYEIIVVDDGSKDDTPSILENYKNKIRTIRTNSIGPSSARNLAVKQTNAGYIAFTDSDCIVDKNWLKELANGLREDKQAASCGGIQKLPGDATNFQKLVFLFMKKSGFISDYMRLARKEMVIEVKHNPSCNVIYKRDILLKEDGFLAELWPGEDVELDYRLKKKGYKLFFNPKAVVYHYRPNSLNSFAKMMYRYGWAQGFLVRKYGVFRKIQVLPIISPMLAVLFFIGLFWDMKAIFFLIILFLFGLFAYFYFNVLVSFLAILGFIFWHSGYFKGSMMK